jgi:hypothetical protein
VTPVAVRCGIAPRVAPRLVVPGRDVAVARRCRGVRRTTVPRQGGNVILAGTAVCAAIDPVRAPGYCRRDNQRPMAVTRESTPSLA